MGRLQSLGMLRIEGGNPGIQQLSCSGKFPATHVHVCTEDGSNICHCKTWLRRVTSYLEVIGGGHWVPKIQPKKGGLGPENLLSGLGIFNLQGWGEFGIFSSAGMGSHRTEKQGGGVLEERTTSPLNNLIWCLVGGIFTNRSANQKSV